jgi:hypothetical protein
MNPFKTLIGLAVILARFYLVFKVIQGLYYNNFDPSYDLNRVQWYIYVLILDMYIVRVLSNLPDNDIYTKTESDEQEGNSRN